MSEHAPPSDRDAYAALVCSYVSEPDEGVLLDVAALGRDMVQKQTPTEMIGEFHHYAMTQLSRVHPHLTLGQVNERVTEPLMELLIAYGLDFRERLASTEQELQQKVAELGRANLAKRQFLANMSHEIRTPLNGVLGVTWLLRESSLDDEQKEFVRMIQDSGQALLEIVDDVLDYSKIEANQMHLEQAPLSVRECIESALQVVAVRAQEKGVALGYVVDEGVPSAIVGDVTRLRQVLLNLLSNAVKFTERGEIAIDVQLNSEASTRTGMVELHFAVKDSGIGISSDRIGAVFESFRQADESTTRKHGGTGLGLAICKQLVELMGGCIGVESELGGGSTFHFTIQAEVAVVPRPEYERAARPELERGELLVVSPHSIHQRVLASFARRWLMRARCVATTRAAAAALAQSRHYRAVLIDVKTPGSEQLLGAPRGLVGSSVVGDIPVIAMRPVGNRQLQDYASQISGFVSSPLEMGAVYRALCATIATTARRAEPAQVSGHCPAGAESLRILMAEDNPINRRLGVAILKRMGYAPDTANDGAEALRAMRKESYDLVFMDVQMPIMGGVEATRQIRAEWPERDQPLIVALTANVGREDKERFLAAGMDGFLGKPLKVAELQTYLTRAAERRASAAERVANTPVVAAGADTEMVAQLKYLLLRRHEPVPVTAGAPTALARFVARAAEKLDENGSV